MYNTLLARPVKKKLNVPKLKKGLTVLIYTMEMGQESPRQLFVVAEIPIASCRTLELKFRI